MSTRLFSLFFIGLTLFCFQMPADVGGTKKTICLNMIVKNEKAVICRCLETVKPIIDYWVIVDTGSTDGTQEIIKNYLKDIPGELKQSDWVNFEHNRNEALQFAKGKADYVLIIDADEVLAFDPDFKLPELNQDFYYIMTDFSGTNYVRTQLINNHLEWKWVGVLHEVLICDQANCHDTLKGVRNVVRTDGARSQDPKKFHKDAAILEEAHKKEPNNTRTVFYLAQSYRDAGEKLLALVNYEKRVAMGGWDQEVFWSKLQIAQLREGLEMPTETVVGSYCDAFSYRQTRAEPLYHLAQYLRLKGDYASAYNVAHRGLGIPLPNDYLFVGKWIYDYGLIFELSISAYHLGKYSESYLASHLVLNHPKLPQNFKDAVIRNLRWIDEKLAEKGKELFVPTDKLLVQGTVK